MQKENINNLINDLSKALEKRDYEKFVSFFSDGAIFETPFSLGEKKFVGIDHIKKHFENIKNSPLSQLMHINNVTTKIYFDENSAIVEYFTNGKNINTDENFEIQSSIALITFEDDKIVHYKDFPNTLVLAQKAGVLPQLVASFK